MNNTILHLEQAIGRGRSDFDETVMSFEQFLQITKRSPQAPVLVYGAGTKAEVVLEMLIRQKLLPICFVDADPDKWDTDILGVPVVSMQYAGKHYGASGIMLVDIVNIANHGQNIYAQAQKKGFKQIYFLRYNGMEYARPLPEQVTDMQQNKEAVLSVFEQLSDETSKERYEDFIMACLTGFLPLISPQVHPEEMVFPSKDGEMYNNALLPHSTGCAVVCHNRLVPNYKEQFKNLQGCKQALMFEPSKPGLVVNKELHYAQPGSPCVIYPLMLSNQSQQAIHYMEKMTLQSLSHYVFKRSTAQSIKLDDIDINPDWIHLDLFEGHLEALAGARKTIDAYAPTLMFSGFGWVSQISELITQLSGYAFYFRCFGGFDLQDNYTLIAIPKSKACTG